MYNELAAAMALAATAVPATAQYDASKAAWRTITKEDVAAALDLIDMSTRYMEVREVPLPSGLRTFSTLQKVRPRISRSFGRFGGLENLGGSAAAVNRVCRIEKEQL